MPYLDGFGVARAMRADPLLKNTPLVFVSAVSPCSAARLLHTYFRKPFYIADLLAMVDGQIGQAHSAA